VDRAGGVPRSGRIEPARDVEAPLAPLLQFSPPGISVSNIRFEIALVLAVINFVTLRWLSNLKQHIREPADEEPDHDPPLRS
jgi:hypothetical protein